METDYRYSARYSYVHTFIDIAVKNHNQAIYHANELKNLKKKGSFFEGESESQIDMEQHRYHSNGYIESSIESIIFLSIFLEAYICEQGAIVLGDKYVYTHLDTIRTHSKWLILTKMISGKDMDTSLAHHGKFKELIKLRNNLVHHKSEDVLEQLREGKLKDPKIDISKIKINSYFVMLEQLFLEFDRLDPGGLHKAYIRNNLGKLELIGE